MVGRGIANPSYRNRVAYHGTLLGGFALLITSLLVSGNIYTRDAIAQRLQEDTMAMIARVIPDALHDNNVATTYVTLALDAMRYQQPELQVYQATLQGKVTAVAYIVQSEGFSGPIRIILGVDRDGTLLGVRIISHTETPGLGDKIEEKKSTWIDGFAHLSLANRTMAQWRVRKDGGDFDQFTGATITPRAVVAGVKHGLELFQQLQERMLTGAKLQSRKNS